MKAKIKIDVPLLVIALEIFLPKPTAGQNPPIACTPDGIDEVCTLANTTSAPSTPKPFVPPAPSVSYSNGQLKISAEYVRLEDVLREVSAKTGAKIEVPPGSGAEPVFANLGPGPARDVIAALLHGAPFNYVIADSANTGKLQSVVLTPAVRSTEVAQSVSPQSPAPQTPIQATAPVQSVASATPAVSVAGSLAHPAANSPEEQNALFQAAMEKARGTIMRHMERDQQSVHVDTAVPDSPTPEPGQAPQEAGPAQGSATPAPPDTPTPQ
jgi:hypothetical protein